MYDRDSKCTQHTRTVQSYATTLPLADLFVDSLARDVLNQPVKCQTVHIATYHFGVCLTLFNKPSMLVCWGKDSSPNKWPS